MSKPNKTAYMRAVVKRVDFEDPGRLCVQLLALTNFLLELSRGENVCTRRKMPAEGRTELVLEHGICDGQITGNTTTTIGFFLVFFMFFVHHALTGRRPSVG